VPTPPRARCAAGVRHAQELRGQSRIALDHARDLVHGGVGVVDQLEHVRDDRRQGRDPLHAVERPEELLLAPLQVAAREDRGGLGRALVGRRQPLALGEGVQQREQLRRGRLLGEQQHLHEEPEGAALERQQLRDLLRAQHAELHRELAEQPLAVLGRRQHGVDVAGAHVPARHRQPAEARVERGPEPRRALHLRARQQAVLDHEVAEWLDPALRVASVESVAHALLIGRLLGGPEGPAVRPGLQAVFRTGSRSR
jgi:hypothetical protein